MVGVRAPLTVTGGLEQRIAAVADRQRGRISREQLLAVGSSRTVIRRLLANGTLRPRHRATYIYGHAAEVEFGDEVAALLACGLPSWLTDRSAAVAWRMLPYRERVVHAILPLPRQRKNRAGIIVHRSRSLTSTDVTITTDGLPVTTPEYTLLSLTDTHPARQVERALDEALGLRITSRAKIRALLARSPGRHGAPLLARLIDPRRPSSLTRSEPEEKLLAALRSIDIEQPECNTMVHGYECDFHFVRAGVVVEFQSFRWHNNRFTFAKDHRKRKTLERAGLVVIPLIDEEIEQDLLPTLAALVQTITRRTVERERTHTARSMPG